MASSRSLRDIDACESKGDLDSDEKGDACRSPSAIGGAVAAAIQTPRTLANERAEARQRLRSKCGFGGTVDDIGILGGVGVESFFRILKSCVRVFMVCTIFAVPLLIVNWTRANDDKSPFLQGTLNFPMFEDEAPATFALYCGLTFLQFVCIMAFLIVVPWVVQREAREADFLRTTPSDFAVKVSNLPLTATEQDIANFFATWGVVVLTTLVRKTERLRSLKRSLDTLREPRLRRNKYWCCGRISEEQAMAAHTERLKAYAEKRGKLLEQLEKQRGIVGAGSAGTAFVVFDQEASQQECLALMSRSSLRTCLRWYQQCVYEVKPRFGPGGVPSRHGAALKVVRAPEPSNIHWDNVEYSWWYTASRHIAAAAFMLVMLGASFAAILALSNFQHSTTEKDIIIGFLPPLAIMIINYLIQVAARLLVKWERHQTFEGGQVSQLTKIAVAQGLNSVLILMIVYWAERGSDWYSINKKSLGTKAVELVAMNTFLPSVTSFASFLALKLFHMFLRNPLYRCLGWAITEDKPIAPELSQWYANVIKTFCLGLVYGPLSPAVYPLSVISFVILQYQYRASFLLFELQFPAMFDSVATRAMDLMTAAGAMYILLTIAVSSVTEDAWPVVFSFLALFLWGLKTCLPVYYIEKLAWQISGKQVDLVMKKRAEQRASGGNKHKLSEEDMLQYKSKIDEMVRQGLGAARAKYYHNSSVRSFREGHGALEVFTGPGAGLKLLCPCMACCVQPATVDVRRRQSSVNRSTRGAGAGVGAGSGAGAAGHTPMAPVAEVELSDARISGSGAPTPPRRAVV